MEGVKMVSSINFKLRQLVEQATGAGACMCWTCSSCDSECPVEIVTSRLRPQRIVRYANVGLIDDLIALPEIWYCLSCRRCNRICPNLVKPETLIQYARAAAVRTGIVSYETARAYYDLFRSFQRVRWHAVQHCLNRESGSITATRWSCWLNTPIDDSYAVISSRHLLKSSQVFRQAAKGADMSSCFTCGECSSACPVAGERSTFDPRFIFRMVNLGLEEELLRTPSIWLCVQCGRCTDVCPQLVDGCGMIAKLREFAINEGKVDADFPLRVRDTQKHIYVRLLDEIDKLLGLKTGYRDKGSSRLTMTECD
jgi:heterodisulfide reductase subunit C